MTTDFKELTDRLLSGMTDRDYAEFNFAYKNGDETMNWCGMRRLEQMESQFDSNRIFFFQHFGGNDAHLIELQSTAYETEEQLERILLAMGFGKNDKIVMEKVK